MEELEKEGYEVVYFTSLSDFPYEKDIQARGKDCKIIQEYYTDETAKKASDAVEDIYWSWSKIVTKFPGNVLWPLGQQGPLMKAGIHEYFLIDNFLEAEKPDIVVALHERNRWGKLIGQRCLERKIPFVTFQEGDYYEDRLSFSSHTDYASRVLVWGQGTKDRLEYCGSNGDKITLVGNTHLGDIGRYTRNSSKVRQRLGCSSERPILLVHMGVKWGTVADMSIWKPMVDEWVKDCQVLLKWHPKVTFDSFKRCQKMFAEEYPEVQLFYNEDIYELIPVSDFGLCLGKTSLAIESLFFDKPLFSLHEPFGADVYEELGVSVVCKEKDWTTFHEGIKKYPESIRRKANEYLGFHFHNLNRDAVRLSVDEIRTLIHKAYEPPVMWDKDEYLKFLDTWVQREV